ncbi:MAG: LysR family transcriptional regulator [Gammaproteobacteria bacterium]|nr:LysR family transcriptional regulator [Gammaproteobacteria bacterium]
MHLTLQQLKLFESVFRNGSYTRAAEELHLTQPAISIQIKRLESQAGMPLFELVGKKIFPTIAGKAMYEASQDILNRVSDLSNSIEEIKGKVKGPLGMSVVTTAKYFMPHLLGSFLKDYPEVIPKLKFTNRATVVDRLVDNIDDFVVMGQIPDDQRLETYPFLENILVPVAPPDHPLVGKQKISIKTLIKHRFLQREPGSGTRLVFERLLKQNELTIEPYMELGSSEAIKQGVMAGLGIAVLSLHSLRLESETGKLVVLDVEGFPLKRRWFAVHLKGKQLSLAAKTFLEYILENSHRVLNNDFQ